MYTHDPLSMLVAHHAEHRLLVQDAAVPVRRPTRELRRAVRRAYIRVLRRALARARAAQARAGLA